VGFLAAALIGFPPVPFFVAASTASLVPVIMGIRGVMQGGVDFKTAEAITGRNITSLIVFCLASVSALILIVP
jgi:hypothetical protein